MFLFLSEEERNNIPPGGFRSQSKRDIIYIFI